MAEEEQKSLPSRSQKPIIIFLGLVIGLGILSLVAILAFSLGRSRQPSVFPMPTPKTTFSPTPEISPSPTFRATPTPTPTFIPTPTPTPTLSPQADLYISEYSFNHPPKQGEAFTVRIGIYNQGNAAAGPFWWEWWPTKYNHACRERISEGIVAHGGRIVNCTYTYGGWANYETKAVADADNEVTETNEGNNTYTQNVVPIH